MKKIILWILVISWALMIFMFSHQPADLSDGVSLSIGEQIIKIAVSLNIIDIPITADADGGIEALAESINHFIRKTAHFMIFLIFGVLVFLLSGCYKDIKPSLLISLAVCFLYAVSDEVHQIFIPGRAGMIKDVFLDFSGSVTGIFLLYLYILIKKNKKYLYN